MAEQMIRASRSTFVIESGNGREECRKFNGLSDVYNLVKDGVNVRFFYDEDFIAYVKYGGEFDTLSDAPEYSTENIGKVFHVKDENEYYISLPDSVGEWI